MEMSMSISNGKDALRISYLFLAVLVVSEFVIALDDMHLRVAVRVSIEEMNPNFQVYNVRTTYSA